MIEVRLRRDEGPSAWWAVDYHIESRKSGDTQNLDSWQQTWNVTINQGSSNLKRVCHRPIYSSKMKYLVNLIDKNTRFAQNRQQKHAEINCWKLDPSETKVKNFNFIPETHMTSLAFVWTCKFRYCYIKSTEVCERDTTPLETFVNLTYFSGKMVNYRSEMC